jgi:spore germination protein KC
MRRARIERAAFVLLWTFLAGIFGGCWDYRSLDELALVAGMAIDIDDRTGDFLISYEIVDLTLPIEQEGMETFIIESEGRTIFEAVRNAKMKINNKLYLAETNLIILCRGVIEKHGVFPVIEWFLRDNETRENAYLAVAQTDNARDILQMKMRKNSIASYDLNEIIKEDSRITSSTVTSEVYEVYNTLREEGISLVLPALTIQKKNEQKQLPAVNGVMVFMDSEIIGELTPQETKFFLFATDRVKGGLFSFPLSGQGEEDVTLEITDNKTRTSFEYDGGKITVRIETKTEAFVGEVMREINLVEKQVYESLKAVAEEKLKEKITGLIKKVQSEYGTDIFGFGRMIHKKDPGLWGEIGGEWDRLFPEVNVEVTCKIELLNSADLKNTKKE